MRRSISVAIAFGALVLLGGSIPHAAAAEEGAGPVLASGLIAGRELPSEFGYVISPSVATSVVPDALRAGLWGLAYEGLLSGVNAIVWDGEESRLVFYSAEPEALLASLVDYLPAERVRVLPVKHSRAEVDAALSKISSVGGKLTDENRIEIAYATVDGSELVLEVTGEPHGVGDAVQELLGSAFSTRIERSPGISPAVRNDNSNIRVGGGYMYLPGVTACTTTRTYSLAATQTS